MQRFVMWLLAVRELKRKRGSGEFRLRRANSGSYYIQRVFRRKGHQTLIKDVVRISDHYTKNRHGNARPPVSTFSHSTKQIIVKSIFCIETYE